MIHNCSSYYFNLLSMIMNKNKLQALPYLLFTISSIATLHFEKNLDGAFKKSRKNLDMF